jgi:hypothetical protein
MIVKFQKVDAIKRLPWTQDTLEQTLQLGKSLVEFADKEEGACVNRRRS